MLRPPWLRHHVDSRLLLMYRKILLFSLYAVLKWVKFRQGQTIGGKDRSW